MVDRFYIFHVIAAAIKTIYNVDHFVYLPTTRKTSCARGDTICPRPARFTHVQSTSSP